MYLLIFFIIRTLAENKKEFVWSAQVGWDFFFFAKDTYSKTWINDHLYIA